MSGSAARRARRAQTRAEQKHQQQHQRAVVPQLQGGELRVLPCTVEAHPFHVQKYCENHKQWETMDDQVPLADAILQAISKHGILGVAGEVDLEDLAEPVVDRCQECFNLVSHCVCVGGGEDEVVEGLETSVSPQD